MSDTTDGDTVTEPPAAPTPGSASVMLLGAGDRSRELAMAFQRLGAEVIAVDRYAGAPAHSVADRTAVVRMTDADALKALIDDEKPDYVVAESGARRAGRTDHDRRARRRGGVPHAAQHSSVAGRRGVAPPRGRRAGTAHRTVLVRRLGGGAGRDRATRRLSVGRQTGRGRPRRGRVGTAAGPRTSRPPGAAPSQGDGSACSG